MGKLNGNKRDLKKRAVALLRSVEEVVLEGASRATGFEDADDFRRALLRDLAAYEPFHEAVHEFHGLHGPNESLNPNSTGRLNSLGSKTGIQKSSGHVQASRFDPSTNQKDRRRGKRQAGGKRIGKGHGKLGKG